ncbi:MAG TPA: hypothetical protein VFX46_03180 [Hyphomicrobiaceae bacterium]|nr:hypothetical protein [Hyphomicrobiaceae bacterium]
MDRRTFLKTTTVAAGTGLALSSTSALAQAEADALAAPAISRGTIELSFAAAWRPDVPVFGDAAHRIQQRLGQVLHDRYRIVPAGPGDEADLHFGPISADQHSAFAFFAGLPGSHGLEPHSLQAWVAVGGGQMLWDDLAAQHGFKPFLAGHTGPNPGLWTNRPLWSAADLSGEPIVLAGMGQHLAQKFGFQALNIHPRELGGALASGQIAAVEWGNAVATLVLCLPQSATRFYTGGIHRNGMALSLNVRRAAWERLDTAARLAIEDLSAREFSVAVAESLAHAQFAAEAIANMPDLEVAAFPPSISTAIDQAVTELIHEIATGSPDAARIRDSYLAFRRHLAAPHLSS